MLAFMHLRCIESNAVSIYDGFLYHERQEWLDNLCRSQHRSFTGIIINRCNLHHICTHNLKSCEAIKHSKKLPSRPSSRLGSSSCYKNSLAHLGRCVEKECIPGANAGSRESMSTLMYTFVFPTRFFRVSMMPLIPILSMSLALTISNPHLWSFLMSPLGRTIGARIPAWTEEFKMSPWHWSALNRVHSWGTNLFVSYV